MPSKWVVHCKRSPYDVYVGRPSKWGNPFRLEDTANNHLRQKVLEEYRAWFEEDPARAEAAKVELRGKVLGCWCAPRACHADILAEAANGVETA